MPVPAWMRRLSATCVTGDEDVRDATANLSEFFSILLEWDTAKTSSVLPIEDEPQCIGKARGRKP
jgi:hypothetical protein